ncbi:MAG: sensor domain-containing protein [Terracidiphilus sp.]
MPDQAEENRSPLLDRNHDLIWMVDHDFRLIAFNRALEEHCRINFGRRIAAGMSPGEVFPPEQLTFWHAHYARALSEGPFRIIDDSLVEGRTFETAFHPIELGAGRTGVSIVGRETPKHRQTIQALPGSEALFRRFFEENGSVMLLVDSVSGEIVAANQAALRFYGYTGEKLMGMAIGQIHASPPEEMALERQQALREQRSFFNVRHRVASGEVRAVRVYSTPIRADGRMLQFSIVHDVTECRRVEEELRESRDFLREAQRIGALGCYVLDIRSGVWEGSSLLDEMFGIGPEFEHTVAGWLTLIHPEDRAATAAYFAEEVVGKGHPFDREYRVVRPADGTVRWLHGLGKVEFDAHGEPLKMWGIIKDATGRKLAELQLRESEGLYRATFEQAAVGIVHITLEGKILRCNRFFADFLGYAAEELIGLPLEQITAPEDLALSLEQLHLLAGGATAASFEKRYVRRDGSQTWARLTVSVLRDREGRALHLLTVAEDINARKLAEARLAAATEALRVSEQFYHTAFETSLDAISISRLSDGKYIDCNRAFCDMVEYERQEVIGRTSLELGLWADPRNRQTIVDMIRQNANFHHLETQFRKKSGTIFWGQMSASRMEIEGVAHILSMIRDVSEAKTAENTIRNLAYYDPLTGLANRRLLFERLRQTVSAPSRRGHWQALLLIDLDHFGVLSETFGYQAGGQLLQHVARRIVASTVDTDTVARTGGNEFGVILDDLHGLAEQAAHRAEAVSGEILAALGQPYLLDSHECPISASVGITVFGNRRCEADEVLRQATIALHQAKAAGGNTQRFFSPALQAAVNARAALDEDLRQAIKKKQFLLYYQPQIEWGRLTGVEALIRWSHPRRGIVLPEEFIPRAEESGLILPLGEWALEAACIQIAAWAKREETAHLEVAANISAIHFRQPEFVAQVLAVLERTGADPGRLMLELTESMLVDNLEDAIAKMTELKNRGLSFSLDDFGTGYSSLAYLKRLPLDQLKIDRIFVHDMMVDATSGAIAQTILSLGRAMGLSVVAEGVETEEQRGFLATLGCQFFQGYLFSRPLPVEDFQAFAAGFAENANSPRKQ